MRRRRKVNQQLSRGRQLAEGRESFLRMDELPDELLLHVLGFVDDGRTLLDSVAPVCRRWLALSRERHAWAGVRLHALGDGGGGCHDDEEDAAARVLLHAPALTELALAPPVGDRLLSALRRGSPELFDKLVVRGWPRRAADRTVMLDAVRGMLHRSRGQLRHLDVTLVDGVLPLANAAVPLVDAEVDPSLVATPLAGSLLTSVAALSRLEVLHIRFDVGRSARPAAPYSGELAATLPRLRCLHVEVLFGSEFADRALADLVRGAAGALREFHCTDAVGAEVATALALCGDLRSVSVGLRWLPSATVRRWTSMECMRVVAVVNEAGSAKDVARIESFLARDCGAMPRLADLRCELMYFFNDDARCALAELQCDALFDDFRRRRPEVGVQFRFDD